MQQELMEMGASITQPTSGVPSISLSSTAIVWESVLHSAAASSITTSLATLMTGSLMRANFKRVMTWLNPMQGRSRSNLLSHA